MGDEVFRRGKWKFMNTESSRKGCTGKTSADLRVAIYSLVHFSIDFQVSFLVKPH